jgi:hypothetical protein
LPLFKGKYIDLREGIRHGDEGKGEDDEEDRCKKEDDCEEDRREEDCRKEDHSEKGYGKEGGKKNDEESYCQGDVL